MAFFPTGHLYTNGNGQQRGAGGAPLFRWSNEWWAGRAGGGGPPTSNTYFFPTEQRPGTLPGNFDAGWRGTAPPGGAGTRQGIGSYGQPHGHPDGAMGPNGLYGNAGAGRVPYSYEQTYSQPAVARGVMRPPSDAATRQELSYPSYFVHTHSQPVGAMGGMMPPSDAATSPPTGLPPTFINSQRGFPRATKQARDSRSRT